jgi:hypothetical protein
MGRWVALLRVADVLHPTEHSGVHRPRSLPIYISNILLLLSKYWCLRGAANTLIYNGRLPKAIRIINKLTIRTQRRQRLALSAQLPAHLAGRRVQRLDSIGVDGVGGKIAREPTLPGPIALGEVFEEGGGS